MMYMLPEGWVLLAARVIMCRLRCLMPVTPAARDDSGTVSPLSPRRALHAALPTAQQARDAATTGIMCVHLPLCVHIHVDLQHALPGYCGLVSTRTYMQALSTFVVRCTHCHDVTATMHHMLQHPEILGRTSGGSTYTALHSVLLPRCL